MRGGRRQRVRLATRRHGVVLAGVFARALVLVALGAFAFSRGWPLSLAGALLVAAAALLALRATWRWERTRIVVTDEAVAVLEGTLRRRTAAVPLERAAPVRVEQSLAGRLLGYGTVVAGELELPHVPEPARLERALR